MLLRFCDLQKEMIDKFDRHWMRPNGNRGKYTLMKFRDPVTE